MHGHKQNTVIRSKTNNSYTLGPEPNEGNRQTNRIRGHGWRTKVRSSHGSLNKRFPPLDTLSPNERCAPTVFCIEHSIPRWWHCLGSLEFPCWRNYVLRAIRVKSLLMSALYLSKIEDMVSRLPAPPAMTASCCILPIWDELLCSGVLSQRDLFAHK